MRLLCRLGPLSRVKSSLHPFDPVPPNEAMALKWSNVNFVTSALSVRHGRVLGKDKDPKTEAAIRDVDITHGMMSALKKQTSLSYLAQGYVFITETAQHP